MLNDHIQRTLFIYVLRNLKLCHLEAFVKNKLSGLSIDTSCQASSSSSSIVPVPTGLTNFAHLERRSFYRPSTTGALAQ